MAMERKRLVYSEAFKLRVVSELENGSLDSVRHAQQRYGITGNGTVERWLNRFGRNDLRSKVVRVEKPGERDQLKAAERRIRDLEHALAETRMRELLIEGHFLALCRQAGIEDPEEQKKKLHGTPSSTGAPTARLRKRGSR